MKITETKRSHIDEGPLDLLTKSGRAQRKSFKQGQQTLKLTTENLFNQFAEYLGVQGKKNMRQATTQDLIDFLDSKNVETSDINTSEPMTPERVKEIFNIKSKEAIQGKGGKKIKPEPEVSDEKTSTKTKSIYMDVKDKIGQLNARDKKRVLAALQKDIDSKQSNAKFKSKRT